MTLLSEVYGDPIPQPIISYWDGFLAAVRHHPDDLALGCVHQAHDLFGIPSLPLDDEEYRENPYLRWTFQSVHQGITRLTASWKALGAKPRTPVVTFVQNGAEFVLILWSVLAMGGIVVPINPRNLTNREEVIHMIKTALSVTQGEKPIIIAADSAVAKEIDKLGVINGAARIVITERPAAPEKEWINFASLMGPTEEEVNSDQYKDGGFVLFTSGTTSLPKGIFRSSVTADLAATSRNSMTGTPGPGSRTCTIVPNNHAMGLLSILNGLSCGIGNIYPGLTFDPEAMLKTFVREKITHTNLVPTMLYALVGSQAKQNRELHHLESVFLGGSTVSPDVLRLCVKELGARGVENLYGMTEGLLISTTYQTDLSKMVDGDDVSVGWPIPGFGVKIVDPDTGKIVPRNVLGEMHGCGPTVEGDYIGGVGAGTFYTDEFTGVRWLKTGDQARLDELGRIFVTGRYKDMIIRGAENISPLAIETVISKDPSLSALNPQVVGVPDVIAGEVPVVVIKARVTSEITQAIRKAVLENMGTLYVPDDVVYIEDLGLLDYPCTMAGKIQKTKLAALVKTYLSGRGCSVTNDDGTSANDQLTEDVKSIWARAVGLEPSRLDVETPIGEFADSITVMRVRDKIKRQTGKMLSLSAMTEAGTITGQINLLQDILSVAPEEVTKSKQPEREGPPRAEDMAHLGEDSDLYESTKQLVLDAISPLELTWDDVEDVFPAYDFGAVMAQTKLYDSWNFNIAMIPTQQTDKTQLRKVLEAVVSNIRILASFLVWDPDRLESTDALHVVMRRSSKFFDIIIRDGGSLDTLDDLEAIAMGHPHPEYAAFPGPLYRAIIYDVKETSNTAMVVSMNHAITDASMGLIMSEDLDKALRDVLSGGTLTLPEHVDYKPWADSYFNLRTSAQGLAKVKWHVKRLKNLDKHVEAGALFPPTLLTPRDQYNAALIKGEDGIRHSFELPSIYTLRKKYPSITATVVIKSALALLNVHRTGHTHALFGNLEAARTKFPFIPKSVEDAAPTPTQYEASDVAGPTFEAVVNLVEINPASTKETTLDFLKRMQDDQTSLTKYASAPLREIMAGLDKISAGSGDLIPRVIGAQTFNWVPGMGATGTDPYQNLKTLKAVVRPHQGLSLNAGMGGKEGCTVFLALRGDGLDTEWQKDLGMDLERIALWLTEERNWSASVGGFQACI